MKGSRNGEGPRIWDNPELTTVTGFSGTAETNGDFWISSCPKLVDMSGFLNLVTVRTGLLGFVLAGIGLRDLDDFENLSLFAGDLHISDNPDLANLDGRERLVRSRAIQHIINLAM